MKTMKHPFSLVEILLALGVVGIGICSVMVLFPVGVSANRDASMETYAAQTADQLLHYIEYEIKTSTSNPFQSMQLTLLPQSEPSIQTALSQIRTNVWTNDIIALPQIFRHNSIPGVLQFVSVNTFSGSLAVVNDPEVIDYRGLFRVWISDYQPPNSTPDYAGNYHTSALIHVLASWPADLPESKQQKEEFVLFVSKEYR